MRAANCQAYKSVSDANAKTLSSPFGSYSTICMCVCVCTRAPGINPLNRHCIHFRANPAARKYTEQQRVNYRGYISFWFLRAALFTSITKVELWGVG